MVFSSLEIGCFLYFSDLEKVAKASFRENAVQNLVFIWNLKVDFQQIVSETSVAKDMLSVLYLWDS